MLAAAGGRARPSICPPSCSHECVGAETQSRGRQGAGRRRVSTAADAVGLSAVTGPRARARSCGGRSSRGRELTGTSRIGLLFASEEEQRALSEDGAAGLVRLVSRRRAPWCAGSIGASNVACRGRTPDLTTAIQAVAKPGVGAGRTGAVTRTTDLPLGKGWPAGCRRPTVAPRVSRKRSRRQVRFRRLP